MSGNGRITPKTDLTTEAALEPTGMLAVEASRAIQQVQVQVLMAKKFPRDKIQAVKAIEIACSSLEVAEQGLYEYERGGTPVEGLSIRSAEVLSQNWGNLDVATVVLEREKERSLIQTYAWDIETNTKHHITFWVRHWRDTKKGGYLVTDERDIYEICANQAARRRRACILAVIPIHAQEAAKRVILRRLAEAAKKTPINERVEGIKKAFGDMGITVSMLETHLKHPLEKLTEDEYLKLRRIYQSIHDGVMKAEDHFEVEPPKPSQADQLNQRFSTKPATPAPQPKASGEFDSAASGPLGPELRLPVNRGPSSQSLEELQNRLLDIADDLNLPINGLETRSMEKFKKPPAQLTAAECAALLESLEMEKRSLSK